MKIKEIKQLCTCLYKSVFLFGSGGLYPLKNCSKCSYTRYSIEILKFAS